MRILIACQHLEIVGGVETHLRAMLPLLKSAGHELMVLAENGTIEAQSGESFQNATIVVASNTLPSDLLGAVTRWQPDVVYQHGLHDANLERELALRFPSVLYAHNYHGACVSGAKCHSWPSMKACTRVLGPACLGLYHIRRCGGLNPITMVELYRQQRRHASSLNHHRMILVASRHMAAEYRRHGVSDERLRVLPSFPTGSTPLPAPPIPHPRTDRILFVGRLTRLKGLDHLVAALPIATKLIERPLTLVVVGDGPERANLEVQAARADIRSEFLGWVQSDRRNAEMRSADLLAVPSVWPEPFGLVGIEAGCLGLPAVGYAVGGIPEWLIPGKSGELADGDRLNPRQLADAIVRAPGNDNHWNSLRRGAWDLANQFTSELHIDELHNILNHVVAQAHQSV